MIQKISAHKVKCILKQKVAMSKIKKTLRQAYRMNNPDVVDMVQAAWEAGASHMLAMWRETDRV
jgi:pyridoxine 5'-phosphate synthase PdxJ